MEYVIGVDLGTSAVKALIVNQNGEVCGEASESYPLSTPKSGYSEQNPEHWVERTIAALRNAARQAGVDRSQIAGISFSGQMHGLVLLDGQKRVIRPAILWNDTRTTKQCRLIEETLGDRLLAAARNPALEGFTLPKLLWVMENEPDHFRRASVFLLPKDYLRFRLTGRIHMDYSDAAGTLLLDVARKRWSDEICRAFGIPESLCPPLVESQECVGTLLPEVAEAAGLSSATRVFAGGADNACGAVGSGILEEGRTLCSIGTSGVVLTYERDASCDYRGKVHFFNHAKRDAFYLMGVTLAAGYSLSWFKDVFAPNESFDDLLRQVGDVPAGANGLMFTPYLAGERTPYADANIRASFIGMDAAHTRSDFVRAVMEGITFSLRDSLEIFREAGKTVGSIVSIGGGAKNDHWLQMQADVFNTTVLKLENEQGPGMGAAMLAALGCGWFATLEQCSARFIRVAREFHPVPANAERYEELYRIYTEVYGRTKPLNEKLAKFRR
jgi:xylulokinase